MHCYIMFDSVNVEYKVLGPVKYHMKNLIYINLILFYFHIIIGYYFHYHLTVCIVEITVPITYQLVRFK